MKIQMRRLMQRVIYLVIIRKVQIQKTRRKTVTMTFLSLSRSNMSLKAKTMIRK